MLPELLAWFTGKEQNRRKFPRKRKPFRASYSFDGNAGRAAIGLDISGGGLCFLSQEPVARDEFDVRVLLDERQLRVRVKVVWSDNVQHQGRTVWRYGTRFTGIPADDWDAIIRYTTDRPVAESNKAQDELATVRMTPDDTARLLPGELQRKLLQLLVDRGRLAPLDERVTPLVQYFYSGVVRHNDKLVHRLVIQSKVVGPETDELFETRFVFDDSGKNVQILN
ncbi:MAG TPA: PilZ domain-containing protein [Candidatus Elarobacter sp.]|jgi:hypothetical protein|nr:PilZ domain-containing protein [Candidatus Elarobacter sp.]